jgi:hypothetical protein
MKEGEMGGICSMNRIMRIAYMILGTIPEGKKLLERTKCRWEDNVKMDLQEIGFKGVNWIHLAQGTSEHK